jgi:hypothetical protein
VRAQPATSTASAPNPVSPLAPTRDGCGLHHCRNDMHRGGLTRPADAGD